MSLAFLIALALSLACGAPLIQALAARRARQPISGDAPASHQQKAGTPTMGGLLIVGATVTASLICVLLYQPLGSQSLRLFALLGLFVFSAGIGVLDDLGKARKKLNKAGLSERAKLTLQIVVGALFVFAVAITAPQNTAVSTSLYVAGNQLNLGWFYYPLALLFIVGFGNAANFTDGLDGLLSGVTIIVAVALFILAPFLPVVGIFYLALAGACAGFLWFNAHPAKVFMGDTGSLAIGMGLAGAAILSKQELLLFLVGGVYILEIGSMLLQRYVFKYRRITKGIEHAKANRVFRRAPLHHHFEELGWPETQVVLRFWILALAFAFAGYLLAWNLNAARVEMLP